MIGSPEKVLQEQCRQLLVLLRNKSDVLEFYHTFNSVHSEPGFPDWVVCFKRTWLGKDGARYTLDQPAVAFVELKSAKGKLSAAQERWREALGPAYYVCRTLDEFVAVMVRHGCECSVGPR